RAILHHVALTLPTGEILSIEKRPGGFGGGLAGKDERNQGQEKFFHERDKTGGGAALFRRRCNLCSIPEEGKRRMPNESTDFPRFPMMRFSLMAALLALFPPLAAGGETVFEAGTGGYHSFRIPAV